MAEAGYHVDVIEKRNHIGGISFDYLNEIGLRIHKYGPHLFHTSNPIVFSFISRFTEYIEYKHKVKALLNDGRFVTVPVNSETLKILGKDNIVETLIRPYSEKMWAKSLEELDMQMILKRFPIRQDLNEFYFPDDEFQILPQNGYVSMFENMLDHKNISLHLNTSFDKSFQNDEFVFNSMSIDEFFDFDEGELSYRSLKFHNVENIKLHPLHNSLPSPTVNFTDNSPFTRVTEWSQFPNSSRNTITVLTYEEPCDFKITGERLYPVKDSKFLYDKYKSRINPKRMKFVGRLGKFSYIDMDDAIELAMTDVRQFLNDFAG